MDEEITRPICPLDNVNDVLTLRERGSEGINWASRERNDLIQTVPGQKGHQTCRREFKGLMEKKMSVEEVSASGVLDVIHQRGNTHRDRTIGTSRTAALWLQYMEMVKILRTSIKVERTANWELHLQAVLEMLPYFAASGHNLYVKCARLYLESMSNLRDDHLAVYRDFVSCLHAW